MGSVFNNGKSIEVAPRDNSLLYAVRNSSDGDILKLTGGAYLMTKSIEIYHPLTIQAADKNSKPTIKYQRPSLFNIENGGALMIDGLDISGAECDDKPGNTVIRTSRYSMIKNYRLAILNCNFVDLNINHSFNVLKVYKNTFAEDITIRNSIFKNISGHVLALDKETDDIGIYNVENVEVTNCVFEDIGGAAIKLHRGGRDESTFGPMLLVDHCVLKNVGKDKRNAYRSSLDIYGVQTANIQNSIFSDSEPLKMYLVVGDPVINVANNNFHNTSDIISNSNAYLDTKNTKYDPQWTAGDSYLLDVKSKLKSKATDGEDVGIIQKTERKG